MDDLCYQRNKRNSAVIRLRESFDSGSQVGSRELYLQVFWARHPRQAPNAGRRQGIALLLGSQAARQHPAPWFEPRFSRAIDRCLLAMKPNADAAFIATNDWGPILGERAILSPHSERRCHIPYVLSRVLELNEIVDEPGGLNLTPRDLGIPNILFYVNSVDPWLPTSLKFRSPYSKVAFIENLDQAHIWILDIKGRYHGRIIHGLEFQDASESRLSVAFAQVFPLFRLMLQLRGFLDIYVGPRNLKELESLENNPQPESPRLIKYTLSRDDCLICDEAARDTLKQMDFGALVPYQQIILPMGRDAVNILSRHFTSLFSSLRKHGQDRKLPNLESTEILEIRQKSSACIDDCNTGMWDAKACEGSAGP
ncbi:hypothetical protein M413DRAFT_27211 [Hebeloma cylindrosporum]|uniref:Uncharacterized protein n=1 Tax=Hebeloma cylindrosporum TaxID=76867 RepID=A0A0C3CFR1_HEBCY|nr:hypothetical protein M413DRAFT_27211 [Hebeloma cylindrosporum h7]